MIQDSAQCARVQLALPISSEQASAPLRGRASLAVGWRNGGHGTVVLVEGQSRAAASTELATRACSTGGRLLLSSFLDGG
jgi:hypothetical protein